MSARGERAEAFFMAGYNCAQAVYLACEDLVGLPRDAMIHIAAGMGGGVGGMRNVCGAVSGMAMTLGTVRGSIDPNDASAKKALYAEVQRIGGLFKSEYGAIDCGELLALNSVYVTGEPSPRTPAYYRERPCVRYIRFIADAIDASL